ncbi:unconventional myosin-XVIIIa isoform X2 [Notolabrus celidotus]|uniref:unconventional myosin-XVIIIa isoform X2 n=1 Tax=Notolabrus celidotus TaxID=1203425 RepID=UPI00148F94FC|nr:unconventional myosin-XVIIIa isoform X2 [Notolabrus celidotus]
MSDSAGFNIDDVMYTTAVQEGGETVETILGKIKKLEQDQRFLEGEMEEMSSCHDTLQIELDTLRIEAIKLEGIKEEKEECYRKLKFQDDESEQEYVRLLEQNKKSMEELEEYRSDIQLLKLTQRKQRMKFEKQLCELMEMHKSLEAVFLPKSLPDEIGRAEDTRRQLLSTLQMKLDQLNTLDEELPEKKEAARGYTCRD